MSRNGFGLVRSDRQRKSKPTGTATNIIINSNFWGHLSKTKVHYQKFKIHASLCGCNKVKSLYGSNEKRKSFYDGLVVIPDAKRPQFAYVCVETEFGSTTSFAENRFAYETKLYNEIFHPDARNKGKTCEGTKPVQAETQENVKISCAVCLLKLEPNGFICINATSMSAMLFVRDIARDNAKKKLNTGMALHADHADFVCIVSIDALLNMSKARTRKETGEASSNLLHELKCNNGISMDKVTRNDNREHIKFEFGHHLQSLLYIISGDNYRGTYWFVLVYAIKERAEFEIDLPGGKRHISENSFECAIRETEEESSLIIDKSWLQKTKKSAKEEENLYFMLTPPEELLTQSVDEITDNFSRLRTL